MENIYETYHLFLPPLFGPLSLPSMPKPNVPFSHRAQASGILIPAQLQTVSIPPMKCPFNTSYLDRTKKADVIKQFKPNWSKKRTVSKGSFYPSSSGFIFGKFFDINKYGAFVTVNGTKIGSITGLQKQGTTFFLMVASGDSINIDADNVQLYFVPFAGN